MPAPVVAPSLLAANHGEFLAGIRAIEEAGAEMKANPPAQLKKTAKKFGKKRARAQKVAILLHKARKGE